MKAMYKYVSAFLLMGLVVACKKEENKVFFEGGTTPQLSSNTNAVRLESGEENNLALRLNWTNPDYKFNTGPSSQNVSYKLEIDTAGSNFNNSKRYVATISNDLTKSFTVGELNGILGNTLQLQLDPRRSYTLEARVTASINDAVKLVSNKVTFTARPFPPPPKTAVPVNNEIWVVGGASPGGWNNPLGAPYITSQKFTRLSNTKYELVMNLNANDGFLILPVMGSWSTKYCLEDGVDRNSSTGGGDFVFKGSGGQDFLSPTPGGTFKISLDFQLGKFTVVRQ
ncbi:MAG TPA: SusE domain-containing protein [Lacibacter sp.]|nr:SusE domain-containing protein [Lacibacter sp.]